MDNRLTSFVYMYYHEVIYPRVSSFKGAEFLNTVLANLNNIVVEEPDERPVNVLDKKWDNLILLDACRHDYFKELYPRAGKIVSVGSHSREFVEKTFSGRKAKDVIYVSGNPHLREAKFEELTGSTLDETFHSVYKTYNSDWGDDLGYMPPEPLVRDAKTAEKLFPEKRKIVHFMQPHDPFITDKGTWMASEAWKGDRSIEEVGEAYRKNIEFVMEYVEELADSLEGKTIVSADHGEFLGEHGLLNHPYGINAKELREVPWYEM